MTKYQRERLESNKRKAAKGLLTFDIRVAMAKAGLNGKELAEKIGKPESTINRWIREPEKLGVDQWLILNAVLHVDPTNFLLAAGFEVAT